MSYYILPRIKTDFVLKPQLFNNKDKVSPCISQSLIKYMNESRIILEQQMSLDINKAISINMLNQVIHTYDFLFHPVSGFETPISALDIEYPVFYDITEIYNTLKIYESLSESPINILCIGKSSYSVKSAFDYQRSNENDYSLVIDKMPTSITYLSYLHQKKENPLFELNIPENMKQSCEVIYIEGTDKDYCDVNKYLLYLMNVILCIYNYQSEGGYAIIKIDVIIHKPVVELIYMMSSMFAKSYIMKPNTSNIITNERYIICKKYNNRMSEDISNEILDIYNNLEKTRDDIIVNSLLNNKIFTYFSNKIEESNIIIGQQQLDAYAQLNNLLKSKNKMAKIDLLQKHNIQKCMYWCEKYRIPYNKLCEYSQPTIPSTDTSNGEETVETSTDELFYIYMEKNYRYHPDSDNDSDIDNKDVLDHEKINEYKKRKLSSTNLRNHI